VPNPAGAAPAIATPAVQHLVVRYAKRGKMRFASHRDVARAFERGVRRAGLPIAYSAGFTPHPKISYAGGAPTGVASEAEYLSLALTARQAETQVCRRLNAALPDGIDVIDVTEAGGDGNPSAGSSSTRSGGFGHLEASEWRMVLPGVAPEVARRAVAGFLARAEVPVERLTDKGVRRMDARAALIEMTVLDNAAPDTTALEQAVLDKAVLEKAVLDKAGGGTGGSVTAGPDGGSRATETGFDGCAILRMVVLHTAPAVRPEDIVTALREQDGIVPSSPPMITRLAQGQRSQLTGQALSAGEGVS
jgi:radical SAM-linked protein